jgi:hypothetical protein
MQPEPEKLRLVEEEDGDSGDDEEPQGEGVDKGEEEEDSDDATADGELQLAGRAAPFSIGRFGAPAGGCDSRMAVCAEPLRADAALTNSASLSGCVAVIERGGVSFVQKARRAQAAGATAVLFVNTDEELFVIGGEDGDDDITLPVVMVRASDGAAFMEDMRRGENTVCFSYVWSSSDESDESDDSLGSPSERKQRGTAITTSWGTPTPRSRGDVSWLPFDQPSPQPCWHQLR